MSRDRRERSSCYTTSFQGLRYSRVRYFFASACATVHFCGSKSSLSLLRNATLPSRQVVVECMHFSISLVGFSRVLTQSRKLAQCSRLPPLVDFISDASSVEPFSGTILYPPRSRYMVPLVPWNRIPPLLSNIDCALPSRFS